MPFVSTKKVTKKPAKAKAKKKVLVKPKLAAPKKKPAKPAKKPASKRRKPLPLPLSRPAKGPKKGKPGKKATKAIKPVKTKPRRSDENKNVVSVQSTPTVQTPIKKKNQREWYVIAVTPGYRDEKVRKNLVRERKKLDNDVRKLVGKILSPKHEIVTLAPVGKDERPFMDVKAPHEELGYETPKTVKVAGKYSFMKYLRVGEDNRKREEKVKRVAKFPGYLIIECRLTDEVKSFIMTTKGVQCILMNPQNIVSMKDQEAAELLLEKRDIDNRKKNPPKKDEPKKDDKTFSFDDIKKEESKEPVPVVNNNTFEKGETVLIEKKGYPWDGYKAIIQKTDTSMDNVVQVEVVFMGFTISIMVPVSVLKKGVK